MGFVKELYGELKLILKGKTLDLLVPPLAFYIFLGFFELNIALLIALSIAVFLNVLRLIKRENYYYALLGLGGVFLATAFAYFNQNATDYFLPDMIGNVLIVIVVGISIVIRKPMAIYASHITRGFPLPWYFRKDIYPAYKEVTYMWLIYLTLRGGFEISLYLSGNLSQLVFFSTVAGFPLLIFILVSSYVYGLWRLRTLKGPSVDEFLEEKEPPYKGQVKGF